MASTSAACPGAGGLGDLGADAVTVGSGIPFIREVALVSLNVSLKRKPVKEITLGNLTVNSIHLSKCLSKIRCLSL